MLPPLGQSICVVGTGARTAVGSSAPATAAAVRAGIAAMAQHPYMIDHMGNPMMVCRDPTLPIELSMTDRLVELALGAAREALEALPEKSRDLMPMPVWVALPEQRPGLPEYFEHDFFRRLSAGLSDRVHVQQMNCRPLGHAGGLYCMEQAIEWLQRGESRFCLVGGVDSYLDADMLEWLDDQEQLHSETAIWGFCPGEGAGFCLLASGTIAASHSLTASIEVLAAATAQEPNRIKTETVCIGIGLSEAFKKALASLPRDDRVHYTICDMNGEPYRGNEYGFSVLRNPGKFADDEDFMTPADCWGDVGAASGLLFVVLASFAAQKGYAPGPYVLLWASSEGGLRGAVLLKALFMVTRR